MSWSSCKTEWSGFTKIDIIYFCDIYRVTFRFEVPNWSGNLGKIVTLFRSKIKSGNCTLSTRWSQCLQSIVVDQIHGVTILDEIKFSLRLVKDSK